MKSCSSESFNVLEMPKCSLKCLWNGCVFGINMCVRITNVAHFFLANVDGVGAHGRSITGCLWLGPGLSWQQQQWLFLLCFCSLCLSALRWNSLSFIPRRIRSWEKTFPVLIEYHLLKGPCFLYHAPCLSLHSKWYNNQHSALITANIKFQCFAEVSFSLLLILRAFSSSGQASIN